MRTSLNHRFDKEEYTLLPLHGFTQVGTNFSPESLSFLHEKSAKSSDFSVKEHTQMNELFYKNSLEPQTRPHTISELPAQVEVDLAGLEVGKVGDLSLVQLKWIALYYFNYASKHPAKKDLHAALADRMYELGLSSPNPHFASTKALTSPKDIAKPKETEKHLFSWFFAHFTQTKAEWETLSLTDRFQWREAFIRELGKHMLINPPHKEIDLLDQAQLIVLHNQYCTQGRNAWNGLDVRVQEALNAKFLYEDLLELTVFPQTRRDVEKMSKEAVTSFHGVLKANSQFVPQLKPDVKSELTKRFGKLGMPGEATPAAPSLLGRVNWKYVGLGTLAIAIIAGGIFVVPPLLAQRSLENRITIADQNLASIELDLSYADGNVTALNQTLITQQSAYDALKLQLEDARSSATDLNGQLQLAIATQTPLQAKYDALGTVSATLASDLLTANKNVDRLTPLVRKAETKANGLETNLEKTDFEALKQSATKARSEADKFDPELNDQLQNAIEKAERLEGEISDYETLKQSATKARSEASELRRELETAQALATSLQETSTLVSELGTATDEVNRLTSLSQKASATLANFGDGVDRSNVESATIAFDNALQKKEGLTLQKQEVENLLAELRA